MAASDLSRVGHGRPAFQTQDGDFIGGRWLQEFKHNTILQFVEKKTSLDEDKRRRQQVELCYYAPTVQVHVSLHPTDGRPESVGNTPASLNLLMCSHL